MTDLQNLSVYLRGVYTQPIYVAMLNAADHLAIPTPDETGQSTHPSVVRPPGGFAGYEYWMAMTPYADGNDALENPCVVVSHNGIDWVVPDGLTNPITARPPTGYHADTELVYSAGTLYCIYSTYDGSTYQTISCKSSTDGVTWSAATQLWQTTQATEGTNSPAIVWDGSKWVCYTIDTSGTPYTLRRRTAAAITGPWSDSSVCTHDVLAGKTLWHICAFISSGVTYLVGMCCNQGSHGSAPTFMQMWTSSDGTTFSMHKVPFLKGEAAGWTNGGLYRPTCILEGNTLRMWYGAFTAAGAWWIGYTEGTLIT